MRTEEQSGDGGVVADGGSRDGPARDHGRGTQAQGDGQPNREGGPPTGDQPPPAGGGPGGDGPSTGRRVAVFVLGVLLTLSAVAAGGVVAVQGTALSADYVSDTLVETNATAEVEVQAEDTIIQEAGSLSGSGYIPGADRLIEDTVREVVTEDYVRNVISTNLERLYAYLKGERADLVLAVDTTQVVQNIQPAVADQLQDRPVTDLIQQEAFSGAISIQGQDIQSDQLVQAYQDPETFQQVQAFVEQSGITGAELNRSARENTAPQVSGLPDYVQESVFQLEGAFVYGFTNDISHAEFRERVNASGDAFYGSIARYAQAQVSEQVPDRIDVTDRLSGSDRQAIDQAADTVGLVGTAGTALPVVAVVLALLMFLIAHSVSKGARAVGGSLLAAGLIGFLVVTVASSQVRSRLEEVFTDVDQEFVVETVQALVDGIFSALNSQFLVIAAVGAVLLVVYVLVDRTQPEAIPAGWR